MNKDLKKLTAQIQKKYGAAMASVASEKVDRDIIVHPTGSLMLDLAIGGGDRAGVPEGRIMEVYGPESQGKCLTSDSYILTGEGYKTIEKVFEENGTPITNTTKVIPAEIPLVNRYGDIEKTIGLTFNGKKPVIRVKTETGKELKITKNHPLLVLNERHIPVWRRAADLTIHDIVVGRVGDKVFGNDRTITDEEEAYFIGVMIADGYITDSRISITNDKDEIKSNVIRFLTKIGDKKPNIYQTENGKTEEIHLNSKDKVREYLNKLGLEAGVAKDKIIPDAIMAAPENIQLSFITGYLECESSLSDINLEVTSASKKLLTQLQLLLGNFGIVGYLSEKKVKNYEENYYGRLNIAGEYYTKLLSLLTFITKDKIKIKEKRLNTNNNSSSVYNLVPNMDVLLEDYINSISPEERKGVLTLDCIDKGHSTRRDKAKDIVELPLNGYSLLKERIEDLISESYIYEKIVLLEELEPVPTFDVSMPKTHSFIANGIINHNTTLTLLMIAARQQEEEIKAEKDEEYEKKYCIFVDAEHALDFRLAEEYGVDLSQLIYIDPETSEQAMDVLDAYIRTGNIGLAVIDSVASLLPSSVEQASYEQQHMAVLARFMAVVMQKLTGPAYKNRTTVLFINQIREAVGKFSPYGTQHTKLIFN